MIVTKFGKLSPADAGLEHIHVECPRCKTRALLSDTDVFGKTGEMVKYKCPLCEHLVESTTVSPFFRFMQKVFAVVLLFIVFVLPILLIVIDAI